MGAFRKVNHGLTLLDPRRCNVIVLVADKFVRDDAVGDEVQD